MQAAPYHHTPAHTPWCLHQHYRHDFKTSLGESCPTKSGSSSRLVTCFLFFGPLGLPFVWNLCVLVSPAGMRGDLFQCPRCTIAGSDASYIHPQHDLRGTNPPYEPHFTTCQLEGTLLFFLGRDLVPAKNGWFPLDALVRCRWGKLGPGGNPSNLVPIGGSPSLAMIRSLSKLWQLWVNWHQIQTAWRHGILRVSSLLLLEGMLLLLTSFFNMWAQRGIDKMGCGMKEVHCTFATSSLPLSTPSHPEVLCKFVLDRPHDLCLG